MLVPGFGFRHPNPGLEILINFLRKYDHAFTLTDFLVLLKLQEDPGIRIAFEKLHILVRPRIGRTQASGLQFVTGVDIHNFTSVKFDKDYVRFNQVFHIRSLIMNRKKQYPIKKPSM